MATTQLGRWIKRQDWKKVLSATAPLVASALGTPIAGAAVSALQDGLGLDKNSSVSEIAAAIVDPQNLVNLRKINLDFEAQMKQLNIDVFELEVEDRKSARTLFRSNNWPQITLSAVFIVGFFSTLYFVFTEEVSATNPVLTVIIGTLTAGVVQIMNFWFGSSKGSQDKTAHLTNSK